MWAVPRHFNQCNMTWTFKNQQLMVYTHCTTFFLSFFSWFIYILLLMPQADVLFHYGLGLFLYIKETNKQLWRLLRKYLLFGFLKKQRQVLQFVLLSSHYTSTILLLIIIFMITYNNWAHIFFYSFLLKTDTYNFCHFCWDQMLSHIVTGLESKWQSMRCKKTSPLAI